MERIDDRIKIVKDEVIYINADAIVNPTDRSLSGSLGLDKLIHKAGGDKLEKKLSKINYCDVGQCVITKGYNLSVKSIIHTVIPLWEGGDCDENQLLYSCYKNSIDMAVEYGNKTIAIPSISSGDNKFPIDESANIAYYIAWRMIKKYNKDELNEIYFSCTNKLTYEKYRQLSQDYQDIEFSEEMLEQYNKMDKYGRNQGDMYSFIRDMGVENAYSLFLLKEAFLYENINIEYIEDVVKLLKQMFIYIKNRTKSFNMKFYKDELDEINNILKEIYNTLDYDTVENAEKITRYYFNHASDYIFDKMNNSFRY
ncbi:MAG: macro domain-containing protein [Terrisporobacter sp.]|uniref:macro domain-containing protein n=1 Tax=Terrisporobacter sp. TaxID=1965305 RepID=UPI002FC7ED61